MGLQSDFSNGLYVKRQDLTLRYCGGVMSEGRLSSRDINEWLNIV